MFPVSIIVPCFNEQATIGLLLDALTRQTTACSKIEVIIADGMSTDQTRTAIAAFQRQHPQLTVRVVDNPKRHIPAGLNRAIAAAQGQFIIRLDAHSIPAPDYIERCLEDLQAQRGENVGGVWEIRPRGTGLIQRAIALAAAHPLGVGDARYRYTSTAGYVDTVPFGAVRRETFESIGVFDERLLSNEDYEWNARLRLRGGRVWLNPRIRSQYLARPTLSALARQYARYGYWKLRMLRRYPQTLRWRQALPPLFVLGLLVLALGALFWQWAGLTLLALLLVYALALVLGCLPAARRNGDLRLALAAPLAIAVMHTSWGAGFLWSLLSSTAGDNRTMKQQEL